MVPWPTSLGYVSEAVCVVVGGGRGRSRGVKDGGKGGDGALLPRLKEEGGLVGCTRCRE